MCVLLNLVLIVFFLIEFSNQKHHFLVSFIFVSPLQLQCYLFQCVISNFCRVDHKLKVRVRCGTGIYRLILYDVGIF